MITPMDANLFSQNFVWRLEHKDGLLFVFPSLISAVFPASRQTCKPISGTQETQRTFMPLLLLHGGIIMQIRLDKLFHLLSKISNIFSLTKPTS